jgi:K+-sensing histidine kinase KdpD
MLRDTHLDAPPAPHDALAGERASDASEPRAVAAGRQDSAVLEDVLRDLQTPVALLQLSLAVLSADLTSAAPDTRSALRDALGAGRRIQRYIDHFIAGELVRDASARALRAQTDLGALLRMLVAEYEQAALSLGCSLRLEVLSPSPTLRSDATLLERLFQNVIESALACCGSGAELSIVARGGTATDIRFSLTPGGSADEPDLSACAAILRRLSGVMMWDVQSATRSSWTIRLPSATL